MYFFCVFVKRILRHNEPSCSEDDLNGFSITKMGLEVGLGIGVNFMKLKLLTPHTTGKKRGVRTLGAVYGRGLRRKKDPREVEDYFL